MKRKCICLFLWVLVIALSYGGGYLCFAWPLSEVRTTETRLVMETLNLKTGEKVIDESPMPAMYLGLEREELLSELNNYMTDLPLKELEDGLVSFDIESYSTNEVVLRKTYYPDENYQKYYVIYRQGRIVIYYSDRKTVFEYPDIKLGDLPIDLQCEILSGKEMKDETELYSFLQNYSS